MKFALMLWVLLPLLTNGANASPKPEQIAAVVQNYLALRGIPSTAALVVDMGGNLRCGSVRLESSFLSEPRFVKNQKVGISRVMTATLLDALAADLSIAVVLEDTDPDILSDIVQNIHHKCVLQIILVSQRAEIISSGAAFILKGRLPPELFCASMYDNLISRWSKAQSISCPQQELTCRLTNVKMETMIARFFSMFRLRLTIRCNSSETVLHYDAPPAISDGAADFYNDHLNSRYRLVQNEVLQCDALIPRAQTDVTTFLKPFGIDVWILILVFVVKLAALLAWSQGELMRSVVWHVSLTLIAASSIDVRCRSYSLLLIACSALLMTFFISVVYSNSVMSYFLDTSQATEIRQIWDCRVSTACSKSIAEDMLSETDRAYCGLPEHLKLELRRPLRRLLFSDKEQLQHFEGCCYLRVKPRITAPFGNAKYTLQLLLTVTQTSKNIDRLLQHGIVSIQRFERKDVRKKGSRHSAALDGFVMKTTRPFPRKNKTNWDNFMSFEAVDAGFDMDSFRKLLPIIVTCGIVVLCSVLFELTGLFRRRWNTSTSTRRLRFRFPSDFPSGPVPRSSPLIGAESFLQVSRRCRSLLRSTFPNLIQRYLTPLQ